VTAADLSAAVDRLRAEVEDRGHAPDSTVPVLSYVTVGDLRAILAALSDVHLPGMVEVAVEAWVDAPPPAHCAKLSIWPGTLGNWREDRYFVAVTR
jgi:hypothetical protein